MKKPAQPTFDPAIIAVLHRSGRSWHVLIATRGGPDGRPTITATREFADDQTNPIDGWLIEQQAGTVLCVLPAGQVICRTVPLPDAPAEQLEPALRLQAEAHLLGIAPPHRLVMAVLPAAPGETARSGIVLAWPAQAVEFIAPVTSRPVRYVADVAAIAALLNGQRPAQPVLWLDRGDGSVAIAVTHSGGAILRATREDPDDRDSWQKTVGRIIAETGLSVGHTGAFVEAMAVESRAKAASIGVKDAALFLPREVRASAATRLSGAEDQDRWWHDYGIAAGAVLAETGPLAPLARLLHTPAVQRPSRIRNALESLSRPRTAATVVAACVLLLMFAPLVFSGLRLLALKVRYGDVQQELRLAHASRDQVAVYKELEKQKTWPMTKLLSDIATNAPLGIELDSMRVDAGKDFTVSGTAIANSGKSPAEIVAQMRENLQSDGVFYDPAVHWGDANNLGVYKFEITGKVSRPFLSPNYPVDRDFLAWTHEDRRDGKPKPEKGGKQPDRTAVAAGNAAGSNAAGTASAATAVPKATVEPASAMPAGGGGDDAAETALTEGNNGNDDGSTHRAPDLTRTGAGLNPTESTGATSGAEIPPPLTQEEINAMPEEQLKAALAKVSKARQYAKGDAALDARLKSEFTMLMEQLRKVKGG